MAKTGQDMKSDRDGWSNSQAGEVIGRKQSEKHEINTRQR